MAGNKFLSRDRVAELTRLIAEPDPYGERTAPDNRFRQETASEGHDEVDQLAADDGEAHKADNRPWASHNENQTEIPRRRSLALVIGMIGLALLGTAGAFGYREMFRGSVIATPAPIIRASNEPNKIPPDAQAKNSGNASKDGADTTGSIEKLVSREEQPKTIEPPKRAPRKASPPVVATPASAGQRVSAAENPPASPNAAASQHAGQSGPAGGTAGADRAHLATAAVSTTETTPPVPGDAYAVQLASERSDSAAQAAFRALQTKYPNQLGGRQAMIRRAEVGAAGIYYRALVGPFGSMGEAAKLCNGLKAAGGNCVILKN